MKRLINSFLKTKKTNSCLIIFSFIWTRLYDYATIQWTIIFLNMERKKFKF